MIAPSGDRPGADRYQVERLASHEELLALRPEWDELLAASGTRNPFSNPAWLTAWAQAYVATGDLWALTVRRGGDLVGLVPCYLARIGRGRAAFRSIQPFGCLAGAGLTEIPTPLTLPEDARGIVRAALRFLADNSGAHWIEVTLGGEVPWLEPQWFRSAAGRSHPPTIMAKSPRACVTMRLPDRVEDLVLKRNVRESVRRARNRLTRSGMPWSVRAVADPGEIDGAFTALTHLHSARATLAGKVAHHDALSGTASHFARQAVVEMSSRGQAAIYVLELDDSVIAAQLVLTTPGSAYLSLSGLGAPAWPYSPMALIIHQVAHDAIMRGAADLCLSAGPDEAKLRWSEQVDYYPQFVMVPPTVAARGAFSLYYPVSALARYRREYTLHRHREPTRSTAP